MRVIGSPPNEEFSHPLYAHTRLINRNIMSIQVLVILNNSYGDEQYSVALSNNPTETLDSFDTLDEAESFIEAFLPRYSRSTGLIDRRHQL